MKRTKWMKSLPGIVLVTVVGLVASCGGGPNDSLSGAEVVGDAPGPIASNGKADGVGFVLPSRLLLKLDDDSALIQRLKVRRLLSRGRLASGFSTKNVVFEDGHTETLGDITKKVFAEQKAFAAKITRPGAVPTGVLAKSPEVEDEVFEFDDAFAVIYGVSVVVADPPRFAAVSSEYRDYLDLQTAGGIPLNGRTQLSAEGQQGLDVFLRQELPRLPANDPLRIAAAKGEAALFGAITAGKGAFEIVDAVIIPKRFHPVVNGKLQRPTTVDDVVNYDRLADAPMLFLDLPEPLPPRQEEPPPPPPPAPEPEVPSVTKAGMAFFNTQFIAGFTRGTSWEWEKRWRYPTGFFRISLRANYGIGLRIPIEAWGMLIPQAITVRDRADRRITASTLSFLNTKDADTAFFRAAGMPAAKVLDGKEALLEAEFGWGMKFRVFWTNFAHERNYRTIEFNESQHMKPPFGADNAGYRLVIPRETTGTGFDFAGISGGVTAAIMFGGRGSVTLDYESFLGGAALGRRSLRYRSPASEFINTTLPAMTVRANENTKTERYGFVLRRPAYEINLTATPELEVGVRVGVDGFSRRFSTGWISLNSFSVDLGRLSLGPHRGTRSEFRFDGGRKRFERLPNP